jgi:hypothetical protein
MGGALGAAGFGLQVAGQIQQTFGEWLKAREAKAFLEKERHRLQKLQYPTRGEQRRRRRLREVLGAAEAAGQRQSFGINLIQPELFREAGFELDVDPASVARAAAARGEVEAAEQRIAGLRAALAGTRGKKKGQRKQLRRETSQLTNLLFAAAEAEAAANRPRGIRRVGEPGGVLGTERDRRLFDVLLGRIETAARGEAGADPELERRLAEEERQVHEVLRRQLGPDYATSSAGIEALAEFSQRANELRTEFARRDLTELLPIIGAERGRLAEIAGVRQALLAFPAVLPGEAARTLASLAGVNLEELRMMQQDRLAMLAQGQFPTPPSPIGIGLVSGGEGMERSGSALSMGALLGGGGGGGGFGGASLRNSRIASQAFQVDNP